MEIGGFGLINPEDYRMRSSSAFRGPTTENFQAILERAKARENSELQTKFPEEQLANNNEQRTVKGKGIDKDDKLYQLCLELETFLIKNLLTSMRNTVQKTGLIHEGFAGKMYEDMLYDEYAKDFTKNASFGLAEQAYRQLKSL